MPETSSPVVNEEISNDMSNVQQSFIHSLIQSIESIDFEDEKSEQIIEKTKSVIDQLKKDVISLESRFYGHYSTRKSKKKSCHEVESDLNSPVDETKPEDSSVISDSFNSTDIDDVTVASNIQTKNTEDVENTKSNKVCSDKLNGENNINTEDIDNRISPEHNGASIIQRDIEDEESTVTDNIDNGVSSKHNGINVTLEDIPNDKDNVSESSVDNARSKEHNEVSITDVNSDKNVDNDQNVVNVQNVDNYQNVDNEVPSKLDADETIHKKKNKLNKSSEVRNLENNVSDRINNVKSKKPVQDFNEAVVKEKHKEPEQCNIEEMSSDSDALNNESDTNEHNNDNEDPLCIDNDISNKSNVNSDNSNCSLSEAMPNSGESKTNIKPETTFKIKCVDIKTLLEPDIASSTIFEISDDDNDVSPKKSVKKERKSVDTVLKSILEDKPEIHLTKISNSHKKVIVLDDSDSSDSLKVVNKINKEKEITRQSGRVTRNQRRQASHKNNPEPITLDDDSTEFSSHKNHSKRNKRDKAKSNSRRKADESLANVSSLSEVSESNDESDTEVSKKRKKLNKKKRLSDAEIELSLVKAQKDKKFSWKPYIRLIRIPAAQLKRNYEKKIMKLEIKRLADMESLKRSRRKDVELSDSAKSSDGGTKKRRCTEENKKREKKVNKKKSDSSDTDASTPTEEPSSKENEADPLKSSNEFFDSLKEDGSFSDPKKNDAAIENILLEGINSGGDTSEAKSDSDSSSSNKEDDTKKKKKEDIKKPDNASDSEKSTTSKSSKTKEIKEKKKNSDSENSNSETEKKKEKADKGSDDEARKEKKKWRKDKLLTENITESDSEEDFAKFMKKRDKLDEQKRLAKRKGKRVLGSDSDNSKSDGSKSDSSANKSGSSSGSSSSSSESEKSSDEKNKKKTTRRRIKRPKDSSDDSDNDGGKDTRKSIRKVWKKDSLAETTIAAEKEEQERKARIAEKQKKYNMIFEPDLLEKATVDKVVLDFNEETEEEVLKVHKKIVKNLKPHQGKGIQFMWDACFESVERAQTTKGSGCILAHCMGLGKTLQVIALVHALLTHEEKTGVRKALIVCPLSTVLNWVAEFKKWLPNDEDIEVFEIVSFKNNTERMYQIKEWDRCGGALILGYDMFRNLTNASNKRLTKRMREAFQTCLVDPGPQLVICDEGHLLKNEKTSLSLAMNRLKTMRRIVLTGTPLQNNLKEYFCMVQFVKPNLLGTYKEYLNRFVNPIINGQYTDSTPHDIQIMRKRSHVLHKLLDGVVQRKDYSVLAPFLPPKYEYVLFVSLTELQIKLYEYYMKNKSGRTTGTQTGRGQSFLFVDFNEFQRICTHPRVLFNKSNQLKKAVDKDDYLDDESEGSMKDFIDDDEEEKSTSSEGSSSDSDSASDGSHKGKKKKSSAPSRKTRITRATAAIYEISDKENSDKEEAHPSEWWREFCTDEDLDNIAISGKLSLLFEIIRQCEIIGDKVLIFSQSLYSLDVIEYFLNKIDEATQNSETNSFCGFSGSWALGLDYFRLDGSSSCDNRAAWCKTFNNTNNTRARLFLISTRAGGLGINLVAANRVIIFDVSWNPSHDTQSIYRVYRFGQTKPSYIYRFVTLGTMEMKIYERQVTKQAISKRVIDEQQIDRHYNQNDLAELYNFEPVPDTDRPIPLVPKDILLGELLQMDKKIYSYHEHQSLLENKEDEVLDEEERKAAWEEFENEKKARAYSGTVNSVPAQSLLIGFQSMLKKQHPDWDSDAIMTTTSELFKQMNEEFEESGGKSSLLFQKALQEIRLIQARQQQQQQLSHEQYIRMIQQNMIIQQQQQQLRQYMNQHQNPYYSQIRPQAQYTARYAGPSNASFVQPHQANRNIIDHIDLND